MTIYSKNNSSSLSIDFGSIGSVDIQIWIKPDFEVFAKMEASSYGTGGPTYSDDGGGGGYVEPTLAIE